MISTGPAGNSIWSEALFFLFTFAYANSVFDIGWEMCTPRFEFSNLRPPCRLTRRIEQQDIFFFSPPSSYIARNYGDRAIYRMHLQSQKQGEMLLFFNTKFLSSRFLLELNRRKIVTIYFEKIKSGYKLIYADIYLFFERD